MFRVGIFLDFVWRSGTTRTRAHMGVHRTCGEPGEIGLTPMGVELNGSGRVPLEAAALLAAALPRPACCANEAPAKDRSNEP